MVVRSAAAAAAFLASVACALVAASDAPRPYVPLNSLTIASLYTNRTERIGGGGEREKGVRSSDQVTSHGDQVTQFGGDQVTQYDGGDQVQTFGAGEEEEEEEVEWFHAAEAASRASRDGGGWRNGG